MLFSPESSRLSVFVGQKNRITRWHGTCYFFLSAAGMACKHGWSVIYDSRFSRGIYQLVFVWQVFYARLLYCFQNDYPIFFRHGSFWNGWFSGSAWKKRKELRNLWLTAIIWLWRIYISFCCCSTVFMLNTLTYPTALPLNSRAYQYKLLLEKNIFRRYV